MAFFCTGGGELLYRFRPEKRQDFDRGHTVGWAVSGPGIPNDTVITAVSSSSVFLSQTATAAPPSNVVFVANDYDYEPGVTAAHIPLTPMLATPAEADSQSIDHALYLEIDNKIATYLNYLYPAMAAANHNKNPNLPAYGLRLRLKSSVNIQQVLEEASGGAIDNRNRSSVKL
jgi:hypothetical protein